MEIEEREEKKVFENVLPLVNIVFLLLIFFMIAGTLTQPEALQVTPPHAKGQSLPQAKVLSIVMGVGQRYSIETQEYDQPRLLSLIQEKISQEDLKTIQLKADQQVASSALIELMELLGEAGLSSIHLLTQQAFDDTTLTRTQ